MESKVIEYFTVWNKHSGDAVAELFTTDGMLRDWDIEVYGAKEVGAANGKVSERDNDVKKSVAARID